MAPILTILMLMALAFGNAASAFQFGSAAQDLASAADSYMRGSQSGDGLSIPSPSLSEAKNAILTQYNNNRARSSCHTLASKILEHSCSALNPGLAEHGTLPQEPTSAIEQEVNAYAASLAICELQEANVKIPMVCSGMNPNGVDYGTNPRSKNDLDGCVAWLNQQPQSWTSFSNSKQNTLLMCYAMSPFVELEKHREVFAEQFEMMVELAEMVRLVPQQAQDLVGALKDDVKQFVSDLHAQEAAHHHQMKEGWNNLSANMQTGVTNIFRHFREDMQKIQEEHSQATKQNMEDLQESISRASNELDSLATQQQKAASTRDAAFEYSVALYRQTIAQTVGRTTDDIAAMNRLLQDGFERFQAIGQKVTDMALQVERTQTQAEVLETKLQSLQVSADETSDTMQQIKDTAAEANRALSAIVDYILGWIQDYSEWASFVAVIVIFSLFSFGIWERWAGYSWLGAALASLASALLLAYILTVLVIPTFGGLFKFELGLSIIDLEFLKFKYLKFDAMVIGGLLLTGLLCLLLCYTVHRAVGKPNKQKLYDPRSPPIAKWTV